MQGTGTSGMKKSIKFIVIPLIVFAVLIAVDQITKFYFKNLNQTVDLRANPIVIVKNFFFITYTENSGSAYGFLAGKPWAQTFFKILTLVALVLFVFLYVYSYKKNHLLMTYSVAFIAGGTIGNFIDRVAFGKVVDFMSAEFFGNRLFGVFNFADLFLTAGVIMIIVHFLFFDESALFKKKNGKEDISDNGQN